MFALRLPFEWKLKLTPDWFRDIDTGFDAVSVVIALLIAYTAYKFYKLTDEKKYKWFSISFLTIALAFVSKTLTNIIVYHETWGTKVLGANTLTIQYIHEYYIFEVGGTLIFRFLMLLGLFGLYYIICKCQDKKTIPIVGLLILLITLFSNVQYYAFHLTAVAILAMIVTHYVQCAREEKAKLCLSCYAFGLLLLSQIIFTLLFLTPKMYVIGETIQLLGFLVLAYCYMRLVRTK